MWGVFVYAEEEEGMGWVVVVVGVRGIGLFKRALSTRQRVRLSISL